MIFIILFTVFSNHIINCDVIKDWNEFQIKYSRTYENDWDTKKRFGIFKNNWNEIMKQNALYIAGSTTYTKSINQFTDWTREEFKEYFYKGSIGKSIVSGNTFIGDSGFQAPESFDWRSRNAVTEVKDQGPLGSSWAYSIMWIQDILPTVMKWKKAFCFYDEEALQYKYTGSVEGQLGIENALVSLSEENLVDCTCKGKNDLGCIIQAYDYIAKNGIERTEDYPHSNDAQCRSNSSKIITKISNHFNIQEGNENDLLEAISTKGPISAVIEATSELMLYSSGILIDNECENSKYYLNHAVLIVGYGTENTHEYYIVKNSWGKSWGEDGYFRLIRNRNNTCGIATFATYPVL